FVPVLIVGAPATAAVVAVAALVPLAALLVVAAVAGVPVLFEAGVIHRYAVASGFIDQFAFGKLGKLVFDHVVVHRFLMPVGIGQLHIVSQSLGVTLPSLRVRFGERLIEELVEVA